MRVRVTRLRGTQRAHGEVDVEIRIRLDAEAARELAEAGHQIDGIDVERPLRPDEMSRSIAHKAIGLLTLVDGAREPRSFRSLLREMRAMSDRVRSATQLTVDPCRLGEIGIATESIVAQAEQTPLTLEGVRAIRSLVRQEVVRRLPANTPESVVTVIVNEFELAYRINGRSLAETNTLLEQAAERAAAQAARDAAFQAEQAAASAAQRASREESARQRRRARRASTRSTSSAR